MGNDGWSWEEVKPYFLKSENNEDPEIIKKDPHSHGQGGYLTVEWFDYQDKNIQMIKNGWRELGLPEIDPTSDKQEQIGVTRHQTTSLHGRRQSTNQAFIRPIRKKRRNLVIRTRAHVSRYDILDFI